MLEMILQVWYTVGIFVAFFFAAAIGIYIFFDIRTLPTANKTQLTQVLFILGTLITIPGIVFRFMAGNFSRLIGSGPVSPATLLMGLGILGALGSLAALLRYRMRDKPLAFQPPPYSARAYDTATPATPIDLNTPPSLHQPFAAPPNPRGAPPLAAVQTVVDEEPTAPPKPSGWLDVVLVQGQPKQESHPLETWQTAVLGRDPQQATIMLNDNTVSRRHAEIRFENGQFMLHDLNSTSGSYINNIRIQSQPLRDNDRIHLGRAELRFRKGF